MQRSPMQRSPLRADAVGSAHLGLGSQPVHGHRDSPLSLNDRQEIAAPDGPSDVEPHRADPVVR
jgi:hypothetical protein